MNTIYTETQQLPRNTKRLIREEIVRSRVCSSTLTGSGIGLLLGILLPAVGLGISVWECIFICGGLAFAVSLIKEVICAVSTD